MDIQVLKHEDLQGPHPDFSLALIRSVHEAADIHSHDFYEIFIITQGRVLHHVNHQVQNLVKGSLIFIRPSDFHFYEKTEESDCQFINFTFTDKIFRSICAYLDKEINSQALLQDEQPPHTILSEARTEEIIESFHRLNTIQSANQSLLGIEMKLFLIKLISDFFHDSFSAAERPLPYWLSFLCHSMQKKENFCQGLPKLLALSDKSHEHLCREFKKHLHTTPTAFINELRLNYAKNLLCSTDDSVINIALEAGFENLSHFYHLFKKRYDMSPAEYRKKTQRLAFPV